MISKAVAELENLQNGWLEKLQNTSNVICKSLSHGMRNSCMYKMKLNLTETHLKCYSVKPTKQFDNMKSTNPILPT